MNRNIGFLIMDFSHASGTERVTSIIANGLAERGNYVSIISCQNGHKSGFALNESVQLISLCGEQTNNTIQRKLYTFSRLRKIVKKLELDVLIAVDVALYLYLWPLQMQRLCRCIAWEHFNYYISHTKLTRFARALAVRQADSVVVLGQRDLKNYQSNYKKIRCIEYIYNPIALSQKKTANIDSKRVIAVGRLTEQKGFDLLIRAWQMVEKNNPQWSLSIFGDGPKRQELQKQIESMNLERVKLCGYVANIEEEYLNSAIFALSSRYEGFVLVLMEALAKGLPCVSFNCKEGPAETIDDGINGFLVEEGNISHFAEKLNILMKDAGLRHRFADHTRKDLSRFDKEEIITKWESLLDKICR